MKRLKPALLIQVVCNFFSLLRIGKIGAVQKIIILLEIDSDQIHTDGDNVGNDVNYGNVPSALPHEIGASDNHNQVANEKTESSCDVSNCKYIFFNC